MKRSLELLLRNEKTENKLGTQINADDKNQHG